MSPGKTREFINVCTDADIDTDDGREDMSQLRLPSLLVSDHTALDLILGKSVVSGNLFKYPVSNQIQSTVTDIDHRNGEFLNRHAGDVHSPFPGIHLSAGTD